MKDKIRLFSTAASTEKRNIIIVSVPNAGHIKILTQLVKDVKKHSSNLNFQFILTSWTNYIISETDLKAVEKVSEKKAIILESKNTADCKGNIFGRVRELTDNVIAACTGFDLILYDFIAPEGFIAGHVLSIPTICTEPSFISDFDNSSQEYERQLAINDDDLSCIDEKYKINLKKQLYLVSGTLSVLASKNLVFSWESFIKAGDFIRNEESLKNSCYFIRPLKSAPKLDKQFSYINESKKKVVYFSLGTIASGIVWDEVEKYEKNTLRDFIKFVYEILLLTFIKRQDLILIISTGRDIKDIVGDRVLPENIHVYSSVPQANLLYHIDLFIMHCGANSANEAITAGCRTIGLPLLFDQHRCADALEALDLGQMFSHLTAEKKAESVNYDTTNDHFRPPFSPDNVEASQIALEEAINRGLERDYSAAFTEVKKGQRLFFSDIVPVLMDSFSIKNEEPSCRP